MNTNTTMLKTDKAALLAALTVAGANVTRPNAIKCPWHDDAHASAGVFTGDDGTWRYKCQTCGVAGDVFDIRARVSGRSVADELKAARSDDAPRQQATAEAPKPKRVYPTIEALRESVAGITDVYTYSDPDTHRPDMIVLRLQCGDSKTFLQAAPCDGGFTLHAPPKSWPLYNRARVRTADTVIVVEGEKCVHALPALGVVATTSPGGAGKAALADWQPLASKTCYVWPDSDPTNEKGVRTGIAHMREVARQLGAMDPLPRVLWIDCDTLSLPDKGDAADWCAQVGDLPIQQQRALLQDVLDSAEPLGASSEARSLVEDGIAGRRRAIPWPWPDLSRLTKALLPGTVTVFAGEAGATKSFALLQSLAHWHDAGIRVAVYELEETRAYHLVRAIAQRSGTGALTDDKWARDNAEQARSIMREHQAWADGFGRCLTVAGDKAPTYPELVAWAEQRAMQGCRIIALDPITLAEQADKPWIADSKLMAELKRIARTFDTSIILVTHPRKGRQDTGIDDLAGGAIFARAAQTIAWLESHAGGKEVTYQSTFGKVADTVNRTIAVRKARNSYGGGLRIAYQFDGATLRLEERGVIVK